MPYYFVLVESDKFKLRSIRMNQQPDGTDDDMFDEGARIDRPVQEPVQLYLEPIAYVDYVNMPILGEVPLVMTDELLKDLRDFGVDNIDAYSCVVNDTETGEQFTNYKLCNVIGLIDVFDMEASELHEDSPPEVAYLFNEIVIDEGKAKGHHLFRPYGRSTELMLSEALKEHLERDGKYPHLEFVAPEDFA